MLPGASCTLFLEEALEEIASNEAVVQQIGILARLEAGRAKTGGLAAGLDDLPLFAAVAQAEEEQCDAIRSAVEAIDVDSLSPREALDALYRLKALARDG